MNCDLPIGMMGQPADIVATYRRLMRNGQSSRMAEMFAVRKSARVDTDTAHYAGMPPLEKTCGVPYATKVKKQARAAGISISDSSIYNGTVADSRGGGDPNAWLLPGDGRDKFRRVIEAGGGECESLRANGAERRINEMPVKEAAFNRRKALREERQAERAKKVKA